MTEKKKMFIADNKYYNEESVFKPENLLREARRQRNLPGSDVPAVCMLDPDGDILEYLQRTGKATLSKSWACYHTKLYVFKLEELELGIIACAVGAPFAVLIAEQLFVSGCLLLISVTSSGVISRVHDSIQYILIKEAVRDEGTSYHYLPREEVAAIDNSLLLPLQEILTQSLANVQVGKSWTTDAPYRETMSAIEKMKSSNVHVVEMEAAALYSFAKARNKRIVCFAHITNSMAQNEIDFEKGLENGSIASLKLIYLTVRQLLPEKKLNHERLEGIRI